MWGTSWGVSTRLIGALIMSHSDDKGLVLPPNLAPNQVIIIPIFNTKEDYKKCLKKAEDINNKLRKNNIRSEIDSRENHKPGWKFSEYEMKGVPIRIVIGPKDIKNNTVEIARRDELKKEIVNENNLDKVIENMLVDIQNNLFEKAKKFRDKNTKTANSYEEFKKIIKNDNGFVYAHWDGSEETEEKIKNDTKATIRCIPIDNNEREMHCYWKRF